MFALHSRDHRASHWCQLAAFYDRGGKDRLFSRPTETDRVTGTEFNSFNPHHRHIQFFECHGNRDNDGRSGAATLHELQGCFENRHQQGCSGVAEEEPASVDYK